MIRNHIRHCNRANYYFSYIPLLRFFFVYRFLFNGGKRLVCRGESGEGDEERSLRGARGARCRDGEVEADSASRR